MQSQIVLAAVVCVIGGGAWVFYFAEDLATKNLNDVVALLEETLESSERSDREYVNRIESIASRLEEINANEEQIRADANQVRREAERLVEELESDLSSGAAALQISDVDYSAALGRLVRIVEDISSDSEADPISQARSEFQGFLEGIGISEGGLEVSPAYQQEIRGIRESSEEIARLLDALRDRPEANQLMAGLVSVDEFRRRTEELSDAKESLQLALESVAGNDGTWVGFARQISVRVTVVVLIIFLVQILVNLFRYSTRLSAFYDARADFLQHVASSERAMQVSDLRQFISAMSPETLDFGKSDRTPVDAAVDLAGHILSATRSAR